MRHPPPALIETIRVRNGAAPLWYLHLRRLAVSCKALGIPLPGELPPPEGGADRVYRPIHEAISSVAFWYQREPHHAYPALPPDAELQPARR